ncbi:MAG: PstS family phosphate ABC transporter substrate-binding protein [Gammaproteobacteria bacterium]|nr:PstS family phosphate ABC transporter substrate-binding protein [Gammaproteobacteria bacterium]NIR84036.1 PstS family phosphate ABC transporter substrate-binding protein [Gammaproteobacteria bacterium]NIR89180.1 PstS family phosphate ABC transporter substrate-binding protein [Gammaproteobacteria bacterium]NIU04982.1 PstS family phosphate ABC transporter substrate-binding protein [Gammaproteobacteria bacterium]NIV52148.1 phosphate ABC transporter substrate-binding protein PstS family protein 
MKRIIVGALGAALLSLGAIVAGGIPVEAAPLIKIDGSSTVYPITEAMAEEFQIAKRGRVRVTVGISGTGGGFKKFCRGDTQISDASRPIKESERELCADNGIRYIELPVAFDALTVVINPENDWAETMTVADLKKIWEPAAQGKITRWRDVRPEWPDKPLRLFGPGVDSGTYDYFTEAVVGEEHTSRGDFTASEDDNVLVQGVATDEYALGFFGYAYYAENTEKLEAVAIDDGEGPPMKPSIETAKNGTYQPLSRPLFIYVNAAAADRAEVREFVEFYLDSQHAKWIREVGYVPLPDEAYQLVLESFHKRVTGTVFAGGAQVGVSIEELMTMEKVH